MGSELEQKVVELIEEKYPRWQIAQELGLGERTIRSVIQRLCERYDCAMRELPEAVRKENDGGEALRRTSSGE